MGTSATPSGEVITIALDLTAHDEGVTVETTVVTTHGSIKVTVDPHGFH